MKDTQKISLDGHELINHGLMIKLKNYEDAYAFGHSILETINQLLKLTDLCEIPPEDIYTSIRSQIRILQSINLEHEVNKNDHPLTHKII